MENNNIIPTRKCKDCPKIIVKVKYRPRCWNCYQEFLKKCVGSFKLERDR